MFVWCLCAQYVVLGFMSQKMWQLILLHENFPPHNSAPRGPARLFIYYDEYIQIHLRFLPIALVQSLGQTINLFKFSIMMWEIFMQQYSNILCMVPPITILYGIGNA